MNEFDRLNYNFMMNLSGEEFEDFFASMPDDDIEYAIGLIQMARTDLLMQEHELLDAEDSDLTEARAVLARIQAL